HPDTPPSSPPSFPTRRSSDLQPGDALGTLLLTGNSVLTVGDAAGQTTGLTISGQSVIIDPGSDLMLEVNGQAGGWVFRWANPSGDRKSTRLNSSHVSISYAVF